MVLCTATEYASNFNTHFFAQNANFFRPEKFRNESEMNFMNLPQRKAFDCISARFEGVPTISARSSSSGQILLESSQISETSCFVLYSEIQTGASEGGRGDGFGCEC